VTLDEALARLQQRVEMLLSDSTTWHDVQAVARALHQRGRLSGAEVRLAVG
jgi:hypothetical protein